MSPVADVGSPQCGGTCLGHPVSNRSPIWGLNVGFGCSAQRNGCPGCKRREMSRCNRWATMRHEVVDAKVEVVAQLLNGLRWKNAL